MEEETNPAGESRVDGTARENTPATSHQFDLPKDSLTTETTDDHTRRTTKEGHAVAVELLTGEEDVSGKVANPENAVDQDRSPCNAATKAVDKRKKRKGGRKSRVPFNAFAKRVDTGDETEVIQKYRGVNEAVEPHDGIHSPSWADAVAPQSSGLLKIPIEIRTIIFGYVIASFKDFKDIEPHRRRKIYRDPDWLDASDKTNSINLICKQIYLDVNAGGWLYQFKTFRFPGPVLLQQFLWAIKPSHKNAIRSVVLQHRLTKQHKPLDPMAILALAGLKNLKSLALNIIFHESVLLFIYTSAFKLTFRLHESSLKHVVRLCKELRTVKGLMSFELNMQNTAKRTGIIKGVARSSLVKSWARMNRKMKEKLVE